MLIWGKRQVGFVLGILPLLLSWLLPPPVHLPVMAYHVGAIAVLMVVWWVCEVVPLTMTGCIPLVLFPFYGIASIDRVAESYANPILFLIISGLFIGLAIQRTQLHERMVFLLLRTLGSSLRLHIAGLMLVTAFLSMWVSNTVTAIIMLPIALALIDVHQQEPQDCSLPMLLSLMYAANIGGMGTLIGTPPNAFVVGFLQQDYGITVSFLQWSELALPIVCVLLMVVWVWLCVIKFKVSKASSEIVSGWVIQRARQMGAVSHDELYILLILVMTALAWMLRPWLGSVFHTQLISDTGIAMSASIVLFLVPSQLRQGDYLMNWDVAKKIPWGVLLLMGGGFALAAEINASGLGLWMAGYLQVLSYVPVIIQLAVTTLCILFLTEVNSNTATTITFVPLLALLAINVGVPLELFVFPAAFCASCAFMLPVATPTNAVIYSSGLIKLDDMLRLGIKVNLIAWGIIVLMSYVLIPRLF